MNWVQILVKAFYVSLHINAHRKNTIQSFLPLFMGKLGSLALVKQLLSRLNIILVRFRAYLFIFLSTKGFVKLSDSIPTSMQAALLKYRQWISLHMLRACFSSNHKFNWQPTLTHEIETSHCPNDLPWWDKVILGETHVK